jgi:sec-independent protein translocase protein TatA
MPFNIGAPELIIILIIALIVLGPGKLPDVASSLGKGLREFRKAASDVTDAGKLDAPVASPPAAPAPPAAPVVSTAQTPIAPPPADASSPDSADSAPSEPAADSNQS